MRLHVIKFTNIRGFLSSRTRWEAVFLGLAVAMISMAGDALFQNPPGTYRIFSTGFPDTNDQARMHQEQLATRRTSKH